MKNVAFFLRLIRWPNLLFIALTQWLFYLTVFPFVFDAAGLSSAAMRLTPSLLYALMGASVLIAAAGYIINDYFDINIDLINKPDRVILGRIFNRRAAIVLHAVLSFLGLALTAWVSFELRNAYLIIFNTSTVLLLLFYSVSFKRKLLIGNVIISLLTAWVIFVLAVAEYPFHTTQSREAWQILFKYAIMYGGFAFIITLIREVVKDMEDVHGDIRYGCTTMPVVWGIAVSKVFAGVWAVVLAALVAVIMIYMLLLGHWLLAIYGLLCIVVPTIFSVSRLYHAAVPADFHKLSALIKMIMLAGILSMVFFLRI